MSDLKTVSQLKVLSANMTGNSCPIIIQHNRAHYFVKLSAGMSGRYSLINEWIGNRIGVELGIRTQKPIWIEIEEAFLEGDVNIEVKDLIAKSLGTNIGFEYLPQAVEVGIADLPLINKREIEEIFMLDLILINVDRTDQNLNLMRVDNEVLSVDYESALFIQDLIGRSDLLANEQVLLGLRSSPLYCEVKVKEINRFTKKMANVPFVDILAEIPNSVLNAEDRGLIENAFEAKKKLGWSIESLMDKLRLIKPKTKEEQKSRRNQNQAAFVRKLKGKH